MVERLSQLANSFGKYFQPKTPAQNQPSTDRPEVDEATVVRDASVIDAVATYTLPPLVHQLSTRAAVTLSADNQAILQELRQQVASKLKSTHTEVALTLAQADPNPLHLQAYKTEILRQMNQDADFANQVQRLVEQLHENLPALQVALNGTKTPATEKLVADADRLSNQLFA
ncbi:MAG TPA: hypothetical protein IGS53_05710 [Leptolyngbyaceae cyanobacterium M33_DOE_097]|uniref:Uncharacterized protein n=1 Tax=Oscillatoriales cyanobacterium SpSt-418 TaxID=2282169 RepID=A0A7C3PEB5_9CYAN|nr:hypothetical protein [Leptolyngbyaceae cyanobacterium M33_DOE_097]